MPRAQKAVRRQRNGRDYDDRFRGILDVAAEVFYIRGFPQGTLTEIADRVGLTQPALYHYVKSKDELLALIVNQVATDLSAAADQALTEGDTGAEKLQALIHRVTASIVANRKTFTVYWQELKSLPDEIRIAIRADERQFVNQILGVVEEAQQEGALPADQPAWVLTEAILGMVCWVYQWYSPDGPMSEDQIAFAFIRLLGLAPARS
ncbi:TetR family transcriptional regulator [Modestobacter lapidis]|nr:TetR/AcrR family transcriptional regulator [Modestobacter lapidis]